MHLRAGDTLALWRLHRLGRSLKSLVARVEALRIQRVGLKSLKETIDTGSSSDGSTKRAEQRAPALELHC